MGLKLLARILLCASLCACVQSAHAQRRFVSDGNPSPIGISLGAYEPKIFKRLDALPANVRTKVDDHLRARLGSTYYSQLVFVNGSEINVADFLRAKLQIKWRVHTYELVFKYADVKHGLRSYYARTRLDSNGDVIDEIDLPEVGKFPLKAKILSLDEAITIAKSRGHKTKGTGTNLTLEYLKAVGSLAWVFKYYSSHDARVSTAKVLVIDAHSGAILKDGFEAGII